MPIYLRHPTHGTKVASIEMEAEYDERNGWERYEPYVEPSEEETVAEEAPVEEETVAEEAPVEEETVAEEAPVEEATLAELENNAIVKTRKRRTTTPEV